jgi:hypothetical protein
MLVFVQGVFDIYSYTPNVMQVIFFYLKNDESLYNSVGRYFNIPDEVTKVYQIQNLTGIHDLPVFMHEPNRLVYSSHIYPFFYEGSQFDWDGINPTFQDYSDMVDKYWGYIFKKDIAPVWVGEYGTRADAKGMSSAWKQYTVRYLDENDLDHAYWPIGDSRPTINLVTGAYEHGSDGFALFNRQYDYLKYTPLYDSIKPLLVVKKGPGYDQRVIKNQCTGNVIWCYLKSFFGLQLQL